MFDYTRELPSTIEYLIDYGYKEVFIYEINHKDKILITHKFSCPLDIYYYIMENKITSVTFYVLGNLAPLKYELDNHWVNCSIDREIYKWRMDLPVDIRNRTTPLYYYEVQGYKYADK